jgi:tetratricopeptide (TPR) repeat protein
LASLPTPKHVENSPLAPKAGTVSVKAPVKADPFQKKLDQVIRLHKEGVAGNANAVQEANRLLEQLRQEHPGRPIADAYHGSVMILIARDKSKALEKLRWSKRGLKLLDGAVAAAPQDNRIRLLRGRTSYRLPEKHFRRTETAIEDYVFLIDQHMRQEGFLGNEEYTQLIYELGEAYSRIGRNQDAANCWRKLEKQAADPKYRNLAKQKLQSVKNKPANQKIKDTDNPDLTNVIGVVVRATGATLLKWVKHEEKKARRKKKKRRH